MASPKQLKNVYTILEKVKKGEINSYYNANDKDGSLFGKIDFYRRPDIIQPHLHYIDEWRLESVLDVYIKDATVITENFNHFASSMEYKKLPVTNRPDIKAFEEKFKENYRKFPKHLGKDIFKMYYNEMQQLEFGKRTDKNYLKYKLIEKSNNPVGKVMSNKSNLKSAVFTRSMVAYFVTRMTMMDFVDPAQAEKFKNDLGDGKADGPPSKKQSKKDKQQSDDNANNQPEEQNLDKQGLTDALNKMLESKSAKDMLDQTLQKAQDLCMNLDNAIPEDMQQEMFNNADSESEAAKLSPTYVQDVVKRLESITLNMGPLKDKIKKLLDNSVSYFSAKKETIYEDLFNSDNMAGLDEFELLHPKIRKVFIEDLEVKSTKSIGKIDLYIDRSGSMDSSSGVVNKNGGRISKLDFCKAFAAKLKQLDMLNNVYLFNTKVTKAKNDILSISMYTTIGGTNINAAVRNVEKEGVNALIITDAEDSCDIYSDKAFFIGVEGARFSRFSSNVIKQYSEKGQVVVFNGSNILNVDRNGHTIYKK